MARDGEIEERDIDITEFQDLLLKLMYDDSPPNPPLNKRQHKLITTSWSKYESQNQYILTEIYRPNSDYEEYLKERLEPKIVPTQTLYFDTDTLTQDIDKAINPLKNPKSDSQPK